MRRPRIGEARDMPLPPSVARFNKAATNRVTSRVADRLPGFGIVVHRGRRSGREYETPVNAFRRPGGYTIALTYGRGDWVRNVEAAGSATLRTRGRTHRLTAPRIVDDPTRSAVPGPVRWILARLGVTEFLQLDEDRPLPPEVTDG
jgi:deazaflavin-dependent oxidoreductase (nitroreductase family)